MKASEAAAFVLASAAGAIIGTVAVNLARRYVAKQAAATWEQPAP